MHQGYNVAIDITVAVRALARRGRDAESEATRRSILEAAAHLLANGGAERLSIRELCARARVTAPTVYHHFGDKAALVDRVVDDCFAEFDRAFARRAVPTDPIEALRWSFDRYVEFGLRYPEHYRLMFEGASIRPTAGARASYDALRRRISAIAAAGRLRVPIPEERPRRRGRRCTASRRSPSVEPCSRKPRPSRSCARLSSHTSRTRSGAADRAAPRYERKGVANE